MAATDENVVNNEHNQCEIQLDLVSQQVDEQELKRLVQDEAMALPDMNIALSGMAGRFPKADSLNEFEQNLRQGVDMVNDRDEARFTCGLWGLPPRAGRLNDLSRFDSEFFGFTPEEANYIDFQLRILYEVVYESIIDAGVNPASLRGTNTGVFFGLHCNEFEIELADNPGFKSNGYYAQFAVKVAQYFDFRGMTVTFDAACASGFVGFHNATQALNDGLIDQAIVCSSNIPIHPTGSFIFLQMQMLSPTGYSRFLDSRADGYVKSEACVSVLLQRKHLALRNYASVMATMSSVDGFKKEGITFPSDKSQEQLIRATRELAGISTNHVEYLEAHGTGTPAGDPQEARAISSVYFANKKTKNKNRTNELSRQDESAACGEPRATKADEAGQQEWSDTDQQHELAVEERCIGPLLVGSVKTNMGHSEAASGLCAMAKVVLMLEHEIIYKGLHFAQPNTNIEALVDGRLKFVAENQKLNAKIIPLSCYGFGGSNVHAIVRANDKPAIEDGDNALTTGGMPRLIVMFGRSEAAVNSFFDQILLTESYNTRNCLTDDFLALVDALNKDKIDRLMNYRGFLVVDSAKNELRRAIKKCDLEAVHDGKGTQLADLGRRVHLQECVRRACNIVLPGVGSQWPAMAAGLRQCKPFWSTIERLAQLLAPFDNNIDLVHVLTAVQQPNLFESMCNTFVAIVAYQIALVNLIKHELKVNDLGSIVGHSLGEISCAYAAQLFDERETIMVAYHMGKTLDDNKHLIRGKMVALGMSEGEAEKLVANNTYETVQICCINGPQSVTLSGSMEEMDALCADLSKQNVFVHQVSNSFALHNEHIMTDNIKQKLRQSLERVLFPLTDYDRTKTAWISSFADDAEAKQANIDYFVKMLCTKVDFFKALNQLEDNSIVLEVGPSNLFESQLIQIESNKRAGQRKFHYVRTMKRSTPVEGQPLQLMVSFGELYQAGATFDLTHLYLGPNFGTKFPVRRRTPSLSSIFKWKHEHKLFVPRYPIQFSKSSAKSEMPIDIVQDRDKYLIGHSIEGRVLFPATGYLFLIWRIFSFTKRKIFDACFHDVERELVPIEFRNVRLLRAIILGNRVAQIYIHFEEATGKFEIKEGGSVVVEGYAFSPTESPNGLLYEDVRARIKQENLELTMTADDIYKQFRVSGYDYGETFRNIQSCSYDGRYCRVKYNGHFIAITDSILQSIFLAVTQYAPSGGLFLPTRFDYVRFQPEIILKKIHEAKMVFDLTDGSLNTKTKREIMTKMMQRASANASPDDSQKDGMEKGEQEEGEGQPECMFDTYCDPITGVIITDGIEMRGIKASPAPRRSDNTDVLLESYQFVRDYEEPVEDERLTRFEEIQRPYAKVCDSMSLELLAKLCGDGTANGLSSLNGLFAGKGLLARHEIEAYKSKHLACIYDQTQCQNATANATTDGQQKDSPKTKEQAYDIKKNGDYTLMSVFDQLLALQQVAPKTIRERVQENRAHLMHDLIQCPLTSERFIRPIVETIIDNICLKKMKLRMIEINLDDGLLRGPLTQLIQQIEPTLSLEYSLAHPEPSRLSAASKAISASNSQQSIKTYTLKDLPCLINENQLKDLDVIVYKDISCYSLPKQVVEQNGLAPVLSSLNGALKCGGYVMMIMRNRLTLAERVLLSLSEPELVGLDKRDLKLIRQQSKQTGDCVSVAMNKIERINTILAARCKLMLDEAQRNKMLCLAKKSDENGCLVLLFRRTLAVLDRNNGAPEVDQQESKEQSATDNSAQDKLLLRVRHDELGWLDELKSNFKRQQETPDDNKAKATESSQTPANVQQEPRQVWLCAVATKQNPINGLIGMMQSLRKELGSSHFRCFYDAYTFKNRDEPIHLVDIERSDKFQEALRRDQIWNCVDSFGKFGSFRHFTINDYLSHQLCLCDQMPTADELASEPGLVADAAQPAVAPIAPQQHLLVKGAYVNNATRGDLSSFVWHEVPLKYLSPEDQSRVVRVAYSALNFRDIMLATGRLPLDAIPIRLAMSDCLLGLEFSGFDMDHKRVMGMVYGRGLATHVVCPQQTSIKIQVPDWMSLKEAATIPVVYATAIMALIYRGRMRRGESILIHAGSGGVGQAAIRLAGHFGLEVFTTVGSDEKRKFLLQELGDYLDEAHIFNSRDCSFESDILRATRGQGVDLVLNSLADDKLQASVRCLKDGGRFLEIGKYDMSVDARLELLQLDTNKSFHGILLDKLFDVDDMGPAFKQQLKCVLDTLKQGLIEGFVKPIKYKMFKRNQIEEAFRFMATGKHIGKVLIEIENPDGATGSRVLDPREGVAIKCVPRFQLSPDKSYIITGGLGGFGLELCKWLVNHGARHLVLTSRTGLKTGYQRATLRRLESNDGAKFLVVDQKMADATEQEGAERLCRLAIDMSPGKQLGGIFHLAMVLKDSLLENMSQQDFELVCRPKVAACLNLDAATRTLALDYFVAFSSVTSGKGNAGQANYAYANSCLERVCESRRQIGQHGLAIQWGAIGDVGVAFENLGGNDVIIGGTIPQRMPSCMATLGKLLCSPFSTCLSVLPVSRSSGGSGERGNLVDAIMHVLGIKDPSKVSDEATLGDLGLDSLMAVEIRQYIEREYDMTLNIQEIRSLTIAKIREINDGERPNKKASTDSAQTSSLDDQQRPEAGTKVKEASSYGSLGAAGGQTNQLAGDSLETIKERAKEMGALRDKMRDSGAEALLDKNLVSSFVPKLELPRADFCRLNYKHLAHAAPNNGVQPSNGRAANETNGSGGAPDATSMRPIFFVPPVHGEFNQLEQVCANIKRPCIGLNWTQKLGRARTVAEAVEVYLELLKRADWESEFGDLARAHGGADGHHQKPMERTVDLVGYSFGATIAFEMMLAIYKLQEQKDNKCNGSSNGGRQANVLRAGQLILLDGSPKQIELGSRYLSNLTKKKPLKLAEKIDELLMVYIIAHSRQRKVDYIKLQRELQSKTIDDKIELASSKLVEILHQDGAPTTNPKVANGGGRQMNGNNKSNKSDNIVTSSTSDKQTEIAHAMEAFCRRYELIINYKANTSLPADCTLIRAEKLYLSSSEEKYNEDLDLSSVVDGKVNLFIMRGDHETFLNANHRTIGDIITKFCNNNGGNLKKT